MAEDPAAIRRRERARLLRYLNRGGVIVRDDVGGAVGAYWTRADRIGRGFDPDACERLLEHGCVRKGEQHQLVPVAGVATPSFSLQAEAQLEEAA